MTNATIIIQNATSNGIIERYSTSSDFWSNVADVCAVFVVVGIVAELLELTPKLLKAGLELNCGFVVKRKVKIESWLARFKKYEAPLDVFAFFFWMIIVTALAGELLGARIARHFDALTTGYLNKSASEANERAGNAEKEAGQANESAAKFNERAAILESTNAQLSLQVEQLMSTNLVLAKEFLELAQRMQEATKTANETRDLLGDSNTASRINETKAVLNEANQIAANVRNLAASKIIKSERDFTPEQTAYGTNFLRKFAHTKINMNALMGDAECAEFRVKLYNLLILAGWEPEKGLLVQSVSKVDGTPPKGVEIAAFRKDDLQAAAALSTFLDGCKISSSIEFRPTPNSEPGLGSFIGVK